MDENKKASILEYSITTGVCLVLSFLAAIFEGLFTPFEELVEITHWNIANETQKVFFTLTNGCFIVGVLCTCLGLMIFATNGGAFDMLIYGIRRFFSLFQKDVNKIKYKTFYDYRMAKEGKPKRTFFYFVAVGLFYVALSLLFLFIYYQS